MFKLSELIVLYVVMVAFHVPVYRAYRRNMENKVPPKIWAAVLLSISQVHSGIYSIPQGLFRSDIILWSCWSCDCSRIINTFAF